MLIRGRRCGLVRLGRREKRILLVMLENDDGQGCFDFTRVSVFQEYGIVYSSLSKNRQSEYFQDRAISQSMYRLTRRGFITPAVLAVEGSLPSKMAYGFALYCLNPLGRQVAEQLKQQQLVLSDCEVFKQVLDKLKVLKVEVVTCESVLDALWEFTKDRFADKTAFNRHWNKRKIGLMLKRHQIKQRRVGKKDRHRKYRLNN